ncbi:MAG TPA: M28 family peptidase [Gemmatimonadaceae bacterium]|nr:M28 family peptidase [Gemmatimonadaceae bacterium]
MTVTRLLTIAAVGSLAACGGYHGGAAGGGAPAPAASGISAADLRRWLFAFADDSMLGRGSGTEGNVKGTRYIAAEVARLGLEPAGENGTYFVNVPLRVRHLDSASTLAVGGAPLTLMADYVAVASFPGFPRIGMTLDASHGLAVISGGRIADTSVTLSPSQIAGKIVVVDLPLTADGRPDPRFWTHGGLDRYQGAAAIAVVAMNTLPPQAMRFFAGERLRLADPSAEQGMPTGGPAGLLITRATADKMLVAGATVTGKIQFTDRPSAFPARDVVAILPGSDPALAGEYVALGGHNDHLGVDHGAAVDLDSLHAFNTAAWQLRGLSPDGPRPTPEQLATIHVNVDSLRRLHPVRRDSVYKGADDDGSGSVSVLALAQAFARSHARPKRSILFVWHTGEELGLFGSEYFTDHPTVPRDSIVAQLNMDMVGRGDAGDIKGGGPTYVELVGSRRLSTELGDIVEAVNKTEPMPLTFDYTFDANGHPENIYCRSDHYEYARYGIPIVFFTTGLHQDYHQLSDEPQYIDYEHMARVDHLVYDIAVRVADLDHRVVVDKPKPDPHGRCQQ